MEDFYTFSFFRAPICNTVPDVAFSILDAYRYITEPIAKEQTEHLRAITLSDDAKRYKADHFVYLGNTETYKYHPLGQFFQYFLNGLVTIALLYHKQIHKTFPLVLEGLHLLQYLFLHKHNLVTNHLK